MLTSPITTDHFHSRILALLVAHDSDSDGTCPEVPSLSHLDTNLTPGEVAPQVLAYTSPWIDICSTDPLIRGISQQVLKLEVAYAAFCGVENVVIAGPKSRKAPDSGDGEPVYARVIQEALALASHMHLSIAVSMVQYPMRDEEFEIGDLSGHARESSASTYVSATPTSQGLSSAPAWDGLDAFGTWDSWNLVRSVCNYSTRLSVGKTHYLPFYSLPPCPLILMEVIVTNA